MTIFILLRAVVSSIVWSRCMQAGINFTIWPGVRPPKKIASLTGKSWCLRVKLAHDCRSGCLSSFLGADHHLLLFAATKFSGYSLLILM